MNERWKPVVGYEGLYEVSDHGRVRSLARTTIYGRRLRDRILNLQSLKGTHYAIRLHHDGVTRNHLVHHLVLEAFVGPRPEGMECCHNDGDGTNNHRSNLRWDTHQANMRDKDRHGTHHESNKTRCPQGHEYTEDNIYRQPARPNARFCKACKRDRDRERYLNKKAREV